VECEHLIYRFFKLMQVFFGPVKRHKMRSMYVANTYIIALSSSSKSHFELEKK